MQSHLILITNLITNPHYFGFILPILEVRVLLLNDSRWQGQPSAQDSNSGVLSTSEQVVREKTG